MFDEDVSVEEFGAKLKLRDENYYLISSEARKIIEKQKPEFKFNGHYEFSYEFIKHELEVAFLWFPKELLELIVAGGKFPKVYPISLGSASQCPNCAERIQFVYDGECIEAAVPCKYPGGMKEITVELNIPSGKMVFANDLRQFFKVQGSYDVNNDIGIMLTMKAYEKIGMAHGFVSNTSPGVFKINKQTLSISSEPCDEVWDEETGESHLKSKAQMKRETPKGKRVGGICTDLWWYCIVDYDEFKTRYLDSGRTEKQFEKDIKDRCDIVEVKPGIYTVNHFMNHRREEPENEVLHYAKIIWNRKAEKQTLYEQYKKLDYTIGQVYLTSLANYPTLYGFKNSDLPKSMSPAERAEKLKTFPADHIEDSFRSFLDHTFCTLGAGVEWHENGWGADQEIPDGTPDFQVPLLTKGYSWYPMSRDYCALYRGAFNKEKHGEKIHFNESFLAAAYNVIHSMLRYGAGRIGESSMTKEQYAKEVSTQIAIAKESLKGLAVRYPGSVPEYCKDLL